jgi:leader peptidase (prepilin peptidase) / N-methyltransferase
LERSVNIGLITIAIVLVAAVGISALDRLNVTYAVLFAALTFSVVKTDLQRLEITDLTNLGILGLGVAWSFTSSLQPADDFSDAMWRGLASASFFCAVKVFYVSARKVEGLGWGDVKLAAAGSIWLSWQQMPSALLIAAIAGILLALGQALRNRQRPSLQGVIPFGAVLAPSIWLVWFAGQVSFEFHSLF